MNLHTEINPHYISRPSFSITEDTLYSHQNTQLFIFGQGKGHCLLQESCGAQKFPVWLVRGVT